MNYLVKLTYLTKKKKHCIHLSKVIITFYPNKEKEKKKKKPIRSIPRGKYCPLKETLVPTAVLFGRKASFALQQLDDLIGHWVEEVQDLTGLRDELHEVTEAAEPAELWVLLWD